MELVVKTENGLVTSSRMVAEHFGMKHFNVLQAIDNKINTTENSSVLKTMFFETTYVASNGKANREVLMNRDGFSLLAMGFTGAKALQFQLDFINEFNRMEQVLKQQQEIPTNPMDFLKVMFAAVDQQQAAVNEIAKDVNYLKSEVRIEASEKSAIDHQVSKRVYKVMSKHMLCNYSEISKMLFAEIGRDIKRIAGVNVRTQIKAHQFNEVYNFILNWEPSNTTLLMARQIVERESGE
ncbi:MAG: Rha family transcriptional regulator [Culicoidibacterales bacterium]